MAEEHSEKELERALVDNVRKFLVEMGGYFTFVGNQYRLKDSTKPIGISTYKLSTKLPRALQKYLPSPEEMIQRLEGLAGN